MLYRLFFTKHFAFRRVVISWSWTYFFICTGCCCETQSQSILRTTTWTADDRRSTHISYHASNVRVCTCGLQCARTHHRTRRSHTTQGRCRFVLCAFGVCNSEWYWYYYTIQETRIPQVDANSHCISCVQLYVHVIARWSCTWMRLCVVYVWMRWWISLTQNTCSTNYRLNGAIITCVCLQFHADASQQPYYSWVQQIVQSIVSDTTHNLVFVLTLRQYRNDHRRQSIAPYYRVTRAICSSVPVQLENFLQLVIGHSNGSSRRRRRRHRRLVSRDRSVSIFTQILSTYLHWYLSSTIYANTCTARSGTHVQIINAVSIFPCPMCFVRSAARLKVLMRANACAPNEPSESFWVQCDASNACAPHN